jgi:hypothetical protein
LSIVKVLLKHGADPGALDDDGKEPVAHTKHRTNKTDRAIQNLLKSFGPNRSLERPKARRSVLRR